MSDYLNFPSEKFLKLWEIKNKCTVSFNQKDIRKIFLISNTILKNHLFALEKCKLLSFYYKNPANEGDDLTIVVSLNV